MTGEQRHPNALLGLLSSDEQLKSELERLARWHGAATVKAAAAKLSAGKRGRKEEMDFRHLGHVFAQDARDWLDGLDPFKIRTNYSIAKEFTKRHPGHSPAATHRRIMDKLAKRRRWYCALTAMEQAKDERPIGDLLRAMEAMLEVSPSWANIIDFDLRRIAENRTRYRERTGQDVPQHFSFKQLEEATSVSAATLLSGLQRQGGMFGNSLGGLLGSRRTGGNRPAGLGAALLDHHDSEEKPT